MNDERTKRRYELHKHIAANLTTLGYRCTWSDVFCTALDPATGHQVATLEYLGGNQYRLEAIESRPIETIIVGLECGGVPRWKI